MKITIDESLRDVRNKVKGLIPFSYSSDAFCIASTFFREINAKIWNLVNFIKITFSEGIGYKCNHCINFIVVLNLFSHPMDKEIDFDGLTDKKIRLLIKWEYSSKHLVFTRRQAEIEKDDGWLESHPSYPTITLEKKTPDNTFIINGLLKAVAMTIKDEISVYNKKTNNLTRLVSATEKMIKA